MEVRVDQASGKDETVIEVSVGCARCKKNWPDVKFTKSAGRFFLGAEKLTEKNILCDFCLVTQDFAGADIAKAMDEAQLPRVAQLERNVSVNRIKSGTNVVGFEYVTHRGVEALVTTTLTVFFSNKTGGTTIYEYEAVPVVVCEAWYAAPSKGGFFVQFINISYSCEKVK